VQVSEFAREYDTVGSGHSSANLSLSSDPRYRPASQSKKNDKDILGSPVPFVRRNAVWVFKHVTLFGRHSRLHNQEVSVFIFDKEKCQFLYVTYRCASIWHEWVQSTSVSTLLPVCIRQRVYLSNTATNFDLKLGHLQALNLKQHTEEDNRTFDNESLFFQK